MNRTVSWSEAFSFWISLFWRSIILFLVVNFAIGFIIIYQLTLIFPKEHPAALSIIGLILATIMFWFAMLIPIKIVLQRYKNEILLNRYQQG